MKVTIINIQHFCIPLILIMVLMAVPCNDRDIRLVTTYPQTGRIEVCLNNSWGTICTNTWDYLDASVACRQLGYSPYG